jgi:DNA-binding CsgD family transcriptional regulator
MQLLEKAGYTAENESETLAEIGKKYGVAPQTVFMAMKAAASEPPGTAAGDAGLPVSAPPGTGNLTLADLCARYNLHVKTIERELKKKGLAASAELTLKKIAAQNQTSPMDIYGAVRDIVRPY